MTIPRKFFFGFGVFFLFLLLVFLKVNISARNEYQKAEKALQNNDLKQAITHFNRAIHWYSPESKAVKNSIQALWEIGLQAEKSGNYTLALQAFRILRSSLYSARSFYIPYSDWVRKCESRIAAIIARKEKAHPQDKEIPFKNRREEVLKILKTKTEPDVLWSLICEIGFIGWIGCSIGLIFRAFTGPRGFNPGQALGWGIFIILFYALWVVGMLKA